MTKRTMNGVPTVLWTDDDPDERIWYERTVLEEAGVEILRAYDVLEAARILARRRVDAMLLDQMLPASFAAHPTPDVRGGCWLLRWLRGAPPPPSAPTSDTFRALSEVRKARLNREIPVMILSAYYDEKINEDIRSASARDAGIRILPKPINIDEVLGFLSAEGVLRITS